MSELSDYRRMVERPMIEGYEATIRKLRQRVAHLEAVQSDALREYDSAVKALDAPPASPTGRQLGPGKRDELPPIVAGREEIAALVYRIQLGSGEDFTRTPDEWADAIISLLGQARSAPPIVSEGVGEKPMLRPDLDTYEAVARLTHLASISPGPAGDDLRSLLAYIRELEGALESAALFIEELAAADLDDVAADGGITVGMVFQQQARTVFGPRARSALSKATGEGG